MSFCIRGEGKVIEVDSQDVDRALCGDCENPLDWVAGGTADCCGYRYARWVTENKER